MEQNPMVEVVDNSSETDQAKVDLFWNYITKIANGEKLNRMILWQLVESYPRRSYDYNGRAIDNNSKPIEEFDGGKEKFEPNQ